MNYKRQDKAVLMPGSTTNNITLENKNLHIPIINPYYTVHSILKEGTIFLSEFDSIIFYEPIYTAIISFINGKSTVKDILDGLSDQFDVSHLYYALLVLEQKKYILEKYQLNENSEDAYWLSQNIFPKAASFGINQQKIDIKKYGNVDIALLKDALLKAGMQIEQSSMIDIVVTDNYLHSDLLTYNQYALMSKRPWLLIKPNGIEPWVGPLFIPGKTGCYHCLHYYIKRNHRIESFVASKNHSKEHAFSTSLANYIPHLTIIYNMTVSLLSKYLIHLDENLLLNNLLSLNTDTFQLTKHAVSKRPYCLVCGQSEKINPVENFNLKACEPSYMNDGGYRIISPEETIKRYEHLISPITGIVSALQPVHDEKIFVYLAGYNHAFPINKLTSLKQSLRNNCSGKGMSESQAKASALCEALERYSGEFQGNERRITASYVELNEKAIHPNACMLFSEQQYQNRDRWNKLDSKFTRVCEPFDTNSKIEWSPVWSLSKKNIKYLPTQYLYYYYQNPLYSTLYCYADSNGNAAGNTVEEAILQGFFELVERDAIAVWWYNRLQKPVVQLESFNHSYYLKMYEHYQLKKRDLWVIDITHDLGIPTFAAISKKINTTKEAIILGFGCHFDANIAINRALTEMNQMLAAVNHLAKEVPQNIDPAFYTWLENACVSQEKYLLPDKYCSPKKMTDRPNFTQQNLLSYLEQCQKIIESKNMEILILNQTRPEIGLSVVKVLCPGLRHFWPRFAPGRLYDVPVQMGWLKKALNENELNPMPIFF